MRSPADRASHRRSPTRFALGGPRARRERRAEARRCSGPAPTPETRLERARARSRRSRRSPTSMGRGRLELELVHQSLNLDARRGVSASAARRCPAPFAHGAPQRRLQPEAIDAGLSLSVISATSDAPLERHGDFASCARALAEQQQGAPRRAEGPRLEAHAGSLDGQDEIARQSIDGARRRRPLYDGIWWSPDVAHGGADGDATAPSNNDGGWTRVRKPRGTSADQTASRPATGPGDGRDERPERIRRRGRGGTRRPRINRLEGARDVERGTPATAEEIAARRTRRGPRASLLRARAARIDGQPGRSRSAGTSPPARRAAAQSSRRARAGPRDAERRARPAQSTARAMKSRSRAARTPRARRSRGDRRQGEQRQRERRERRSRPSPGPPFNRRRRRTAVRKLRMRSLSDIARAATRIAQKSPPIRGARRCREVATGKCDPDRRHGPEDRDFRHLSSVSRLHWKGSSHGKPRQHGRWSSWDCPKRLRRERRIRSAISTRQSRPTRGGDRAGAEPAPHGRPSTPLFAVAMRIMRDRDDAEDQS